MPLWITWLIALVRGWFGIKADIHDKEQQEVGQARQVAAQDETLLYEVKKAHDADIAIARLSDDAIKLQTAKFKRPD